MHINLPDDIDAPIADDKLNLCDYAVAFIDLLGQRAAMPERHLPPNKEEATAIVKKSVGRIVGTQKLFESFYNSYASTQSLYSIFPQALKSPVPDMAPGKLKWQYFSDGLIVYIPLGSGLIESPVNSLFSLIFASGLLCLTGLATKGPIRAGIDVAWAVEYRPNELYGSAIAHAYKLESEVAQWPRVVVGEGLTSYLNHYATEDGSGFSSQFRRAMGGRCLDLLTTDIDGNYMVDYLGQGFRETTNGTLDNNLVEKAQAYVDEQIAFWRATNNQKLLDRYEIVRSYLSGNAPKI